jgi:hypothetical protein
MRATKLPVQTGLFSMLCSSRSKKTNPICPIAQHCHANMLTYVEHYQPDYFLLENVAGLLDHHEFGWWNTGMTLALCQRALFRRDILRDKNNACFRWPDVPWNVPPFPCGWDGILGRSHVSRSVSSDLLFLSLQVLWNQGTGRRNTLVTVGKDPCYRGKDDLGAKHSPNDRTCACPPVFLALGPSAGSVAPVFGLLP